MRLIKLLPFFLFFIFVKCSFSPQKEAQVKLEKTPEQLQAEEQARQDSIESAAFEQMQKTAFAGFTFGMKETEAEDINPGKEKLGKFNYRFSPQFDGNDELYKLTLSSEGVKTIKFETDLLVNYNNLYKIVETRYGKPLASKKFPSIFDVQSSKKYLMSKWEQGTKNIQISLVENSLNSYAVVCDIFDKNMSEAEKERLYKLKNKDVLDAAEKF